MGVHQRAQLIFDKHRKLGSVGIRSGLRQSPGTGGQFIQLLTVFSNFFVKSLFSRVDKTRHVGLIFFFDGVVTAFVFIEGF